MAEASEDGQRLALHPPLHTLLHGPTIEGRALAREGELRLGACARDTLCCAAARVGSPSPVTAAATVAELLETELGPPPHVLVFPADLHFTEEEALRAFAGLRP